MKQNLSFTICILTVAALLANVACSHKTKPEDITIVETSKKEREVGEPVTFHRPTKSVKTYPSFHCSHKVGSTISAEDKVTLTYKTDTVEIDYTIKMKKDGKLKVNSSDGTYPSISGTEDTFELCWREENCLVMKKNKDGTWTIKSLPFVK